MTKIQLFPYYTYYKDRVAGFNTAPKDPVLKVHLLPLDPKYHNEHYFWFENKDAPFA